MSIHHQGSRSLPSSFKVKPRNTYHFSPPRPSLTPSISKISAIATQQTNATYKSEIKTPETGYSARPATARPTTAKQPNTCSNIIMAIAEGRGVATEVGICIFDVNSCEADLSQVSNNI